MAHIPPIHRAASSGNMEEVLRLIHQDPQVVKSIDCDGSIPLLYASEKGHVSVVAALVDHGANIDRRTYYGHTALYLACRNRHVPVVELLLEKGATPTLPTNNGWTPLMAASYWGRVGIVACLLQHPSVLSTINHHDHFKGWTALYLAGEEGHPDIVKMLLEAGADPTIRLKDGKTAMDIATKRGRKECVSFLKEWDRSYTINKARLLYDAFCRYPQQHGGGPSASTSTGASDKRPRVEAVIPTYLKGRQQGEQTLPKVEMVDDYEEGSLVESVLEYVICGGLKGELFVEFMEMLGKTGYRQEEEEEA